MFADRLSDVVGGARDGMSSRSSSRQVLLSTRRVQECAREVSGDGASGGFENDRKRERNGDGGGFQRGCSALSARHVGASTFKMQIREAESTRGGGGPQTQT